jgi:hypothetical protein
VHGRRPRRLTRRQVVSEAAGQQPQAPPQQPPPAAAGRAPGPEERPVTATVDSRRTVSSWPAGQAAGAAESDIARLTSKVSPHARQRNSYLGTDP